MQTMRFRACLAELHRVVRSDFFSAAPDFEKSFFFFFFFLQISDRDLSSSQRKLSSSLGFCLWGSQLHPPQPSQGANANLWWSFHSGRGWVQVEVGGVAVERN